MAKEDYHEFEASLIYIIRFCLIKRKKEKKKEWGDEIGEAHKIELRVSVRRRGLFCAFR